MNSLDKLAAAREFLEKAGIDNAGREAELIISHCLGMDRVILYKDNPVIPDERLPRIDEYLERRSKREPLQYILGYADFHALKIRVGKGVLIPRPETELLVVEAIKTVTSYKLQVASKNKQSSLNILDLCTGSGCIALALAKEFPDTHAYGTDSSEIALEYAKENARINKINNVTFLKGNLFEPVRKLTFNLVVSNPPYVKSNNIRDLQPEIKDWEPGEALDGGEDGLDYYRAIVPESRRYLKEGGHLILELGISEADAVIKMAEDAGFIDISIIKDYAGIERILAAK